MYSDNLDNVTQVLPNFKTRAYRRRALSTDINIRPQGQLLASKCLSRKAVLDFGRFCQYISLLGVIPLLWDETHQNFVRRRPKFLRIMSFVSHTYNFLCMLNLLLFLLLQVDTGSAYEKDREKVEKISKLIWLVISFMSFTLALHLVLKRNQLQMFLNQFIKVLYLFDGPEMKGRKERNSLEIGLYLIGMCPFVISLPVAFSRICVDSGERDAFSNRNMCSFFWGKFLLVLFGTYMFHLYSSIISFNILYNWAYFYIMPHWLTRLRNEIQKHPRIPLLQHYQVLELLNNLYNESCSRIQGILLQAFAIALLCLSFWGIQATKSCADSSLSALLLFFATIITVILLQSTCFKKIVSIYETSLKITQIYLKRTSGYAYSCLTLNSFHPLKICFFGCTSNKIWLIEMSVFMKCIIFARALWK